MRRMRRNPSGDGKLFCVSLPGRDCYEWLPVKLISRLILYPLSLYFAIWCWGGFRDAYENMQLNRFSVELDGEEEKPVEVRGEETGSTDKGYDLGEVNRMLSNTPPAKADALRAWGAEVVSEGAVWDDANAAALESARRDGLSYVHPFADPLVIAGQGTVGLEIVEQVPGVTLKVVRDV